MVFALKLEGSTCCHHLHHLFFSGESWRPVKIKMLSMSSLLPFDYFPNLVHLEDQICTTVLMLLCELPKTSSRISAVCCFSSFLTEVSSPWPGAFPLQGLLIIYRVSHCEKCGLVILKECCFLKCFLIYHKFAQINKKHPHAPKMGISIKNFKTNQASGFRFFF